MEMTPSRYASKAIFRTGKSQASLLSTSKHCAVDLNHEVEESLCEKQEYRVFLDNPLKMGFFLDTIGNGMVGIYTLYPMLLKIYILTLQMNTHILL